MQLEIRSWRPLKVQEEEYSRAHFQFQQSQSMYNRFRACNRSIKRALMTWCFHRLGMWKITAHYEDDKENVAFREFKVQQFGGRNPLVMSCLKVTLIYLFILTHSSFTQLWSEHRHEGALHTVIRKRLWFQHIGHVSSGRETTQLGIKKLIKGPKFVFCSYSHGETVKGAYHCYFGVVDKDTRKPTLIQGMVLTGSVRAHPTSADPNLSPTHHMYFTHWFPAGSGRNRGRLLPACGNRPAPPKAHETNAQQTAENRVAALFESHRHQCAK